MAKKSEDYDAFIDKFKPKLTTDDCYTPPEVYDAVLGWARKHCNICPNDKILRPFRPGGDYQSEDYPADCVVVDNPPFSIFAPIRRWYMERGIRYFLFAPAKTILNVDIPDTRIVTGVNVTYENGAVVSTSFVTNCLREPGVLALASPSLRNAVVEADKLQWKHWRKELPQYIYPQEVLTFSKLEAIAKGRSEFAIYRQEASFIRALDSQREAKKAIYGGGFLLSRAAAAREAAANKPIVWGLSERELRIIESLK